ncbi:hypothetical protein V8E53_014391 [Lactarius tabidus]
MTSSSLQASLKLQSHAGHSQARSGGPARVLLWVEKDDAEKVVFDLDKEGSGFEEYVATNGEIDDTMTSHVTNQRVVLVDYIPANGMSVAGVGNLSANVEGHRSLMLQMKYGDLVYNLKLNNVLYIYQIVTV